MNLLSALITSPVLGHAEWPLPCPLDTPVATQLRSPNGAAGVPVCLKLAAPVALDRSTPPPSVIRGHGDGRRVGRIKRQGVASWQRKRRARKRNRRATEPRLEHHDFDVAKRPRPAYIRHRRGPSIGAVKRAPTVACVAYLKDPAAKLLTKDEARRIAANIAKLPELLSRHKTWG